MCVFTRRSYTHSSLVQLILTILSLYQLTCRPSTLEMRNTSNSTKRNNIKRRIRAIYYWSYNTRSSPAGIKQNKRSKYTTAKFKALATTYRLEMMPILEIIQTPQTLLQDTTEVARLPHQNTIFLQFLACLAQNPSAFTSRCPTDKEGRGALEPPPEDFYVFHSFKPCRRQAKRTNAQAC